MAVARIVWTRKSDAAINDFKTNAFCPYCDKKLDVESLQANCPQCNLHIDYPDYIKEKFKKKPDCSNYHVQIKL